jgi:hypothetical protein
MGRNPTEQATPDLFATDMVRDASPSPTMPPAAEPAADTPAQRYVLPKNLGHAIKQLSDRELDELVEAAFDESKRRGRLPLAVGTDPTQLQRERPPSKEKASQRRHGDIAEVALTRGQVNAVRAAFKADISPSRIARQFGIPLSNVRKALASNDPTR